MRGTQVLGQGTQVSGQGTQVSGQGAQEPGYSMLPSTVYLYSECLNPHGYIFKQAKMILR